MAKNDEQPKTGPTTHYAVEASVVQLIRENIGSQPVDEVEGIFLGLLRATAIPLSLAQAPGVDGQQQQQPRKKRAAKKHAVTH